ncbi:MAG: hypothetical protein OQL06_00660 [Gammaproteobacteria bacterium]|nr:hypothetical protein [Gammaproteobacteria bacterium]
MTTKKTVLLLYPSAANQQTGAALKEALQAQGTPVEELVMEQNYGAVLDRLQQSVIPLVIN